MKEIWLSATGDGKIY